MSAFLVSKAHIDALMTAALEWGMVQNDITDPDNGPTAIGQILWRENSKSVNARYGERGSCPEYVFERRQVPLTAVEVIKAVHCLEYQSCEHRGWERSKAKKLCTALIALATRHVFGYNDAAWGIDR